MGDETLERDCTNNGQPVKNPAVKRKKIDGGLLFYWVMFAIPLIQFAIFYVGVNFNSIRLAFMKYDNVQRDYIFAGFHNFRLFFFGGPTGTDMAAILPALKNSFIYFVVGFGITLPLTLIFSYYIYKKFFMASFFKVILFLPTIISIVIFTIFFKSFMQQTLPAIGAKNSNLAWMGELLSDAHPEKQFWTMLFFNVWVGFGPTMLVYVNAMSNVSDSLVEAAAIDGASELRQFFSVIIPSIWPTLVSLSIIQFAQFFNNQANMYTFFKSSADETLQTLGYYLFNLVANAEANQASGGVKIYYPYASAVGLMFTLVLAPITLLVRWAMTKFGPNEE